MKKALLLFAKESVAKKRVFPNELTTLINGANKGIVAESVLLEDLLFVLKDGEADIRDDGRGRSVRDYDVVYFRSWGSNQAATQATARFCALNGIPFVDREALRVGAPRNKTNQYMNLHEAGVRFPATLIARPEILQANYKAYGFDFPLIIKHVSGARGQDNHLVKTLAGMEAVLAGRSEEVFVLQTFVPNDGDYRVLVMGDQVVGLIRREAVAGSHLNNTSMGGVATLLPLDTLPQEVLDDSIRAAQFFGIDVAGVDMIHSSADNRYYCLEVNRAPQIERASFEREKAALLAGYLKAIAR